jgi:hypothetical protein
MLIVIPAQDGHNLTKLAVASMNHTVRDHGVSNFEVLIIDNDSEIPYTREEFGDLRFPLKVLNNRFNTGYYEPLVIARDWYPDQELIGLMHNDMVIYEDAWNLRLEEAFYFDDNLKLVGFCGSNEVDERGGRGSGTVVNFRGAPGYQPSTTGLRKRELTPAACLDSMFMMFTDDAIELLNEDWDRLPLAHFYDRIWPLRLIEKGFHVATLGVEIDHMGGMTTVGNVRYRDDCIRWLKDQNIPFENPETEMYLEAERRYFSEFKGRIFPCRIGGDYAYHSAN